MSLGLAAVCFSFYVLEISPEPCKPCKIAAFLHILSVVVASTVSDKFLSFLGPTLPILWVCTLPFLVFSLKGYLAYGESRYLSGVRRDILNLDDVEILLGSVTIILAAIVSVQVSTLWVGLGLWTISLAMTFAGFFVLWIGSMRPSYGERKLISSVPVLLMFVTYFAGALIYIANKRNTMLLPDILKLRP
jgi:hypothetical protein